MCGVRDFSLAGLKERLSAGAARMLGMLPDVAQARTLFESTQTHIQMSSFYSFQYTLPIKADRTLSHISAILASMLVRRVSCGQTRKVDPQLS